MGDLPKETFLKFKPNQKEIIRKMYNLDKPERMKEALDLMTDWIRKQAHFRKKDFSSEYLERLIISNKGLMEKSKVRLDKLCTFRTLWSQYFTPVDVHSLEKYFNYYNMFVLPEPTDELCRVGIFKVFPISPMYPDIINEILKYTVVIGEYLKLKEFVDGFILIPDIRGCNMSDLLGVLTLSEFRRAVSLLVDGYGVRVKYLHLLTTSKFSDALVTLLKQGISKKLADRLHVHTRLETLHEFIPKKVLPVEYGGEAGPMDEIREKFHRELCTEEHIEYLKKMADASTDESKRSKDLFNDTYVDTPGAFRTLVLD